VYNFFKRHQESRYYHLGLAIALMS
jgi:hypothetical protein